MFLKIKLNPFLHCKYVKRNLSIHIMYKNNRNWADTIFFALKILLVNIVHQNQFRPEIQLQILNWPSPMISYDTD